MVRGEVSRILMRLGRNVDIEIILKKFESVYDIVDIKEEFLVKLYSIK